MIVEFSSKRKSLTSRTTSYEGYGAVSDRVEGVEVESLAGVELAGELSFSSTSAESRTEQGYHVMPCSSRS